MLIDTLRACWPVFAGALFFLIHGFFWRFYEARAMEDSPKSYEWVISYRTGGFPFRRKLLGSPRLRVWALLTALAAAAAFFCGRQLCTTLNPLTASRIAPFAGSRWLLLLGLCMLGGGAVYCLLTLLFDSTWVSLPGALLFSAAAVRDDGANALLAFALLLVLLYLREGRPGFPAELLYLAALPVLALAVAVRPAFLWLLPCFAAVHWYKLLHQLRGRRFSGMKLVLTVGASLAVWVLAAVLAALSHPSLEAWTQTLVANSSADPATLVKTRTVNQLFRDAVGAFSVPLSTGVLDLAADAPLLGFGLWGCCSAWVLAWKRRDARGYFTLAVLAAQLLLWLATWNGTPILGLTLSAACILRDADRAKKRISAAVVPALGIAWYLFIHIAARALPLAAQLRVLL